MFKWEIINPMTGETKMTVPFKWMARIIATYRLIGNEYWDFAKKGEGWI